MSIFSRTRDIFAANMTELLDRAEDPARMIRMIILEMEETLVEVRASAARSIADGKEMRRAMNRLEEIQASWTEKAQLALSKDREDLAKAWYKSPIVRTWNGPINSSGRAWLSSTRSSAPAAPRRSTARCW